MKIITSAPPPAIAPESSKLNGIPPLLTRTRLLTLTGMDGCVKTRLARRVASELNAAHGFGDGVCWVALDSLHLDGG